MVLRNIFKGSERHPSTFHRPTSWCYFLLELILKQAVARSYTHALHAAFSLENLMNKICSCLMHYVLLEVVVATQLGNITYRPAGEKVQFYLAISAMHQP